MTIQRHKLFNGVYFK